MTQVKLQDVRLAFAQIWEAKPFQPGSPAKFNASFLFDPKHPAAKLIEAAIKETAKEKWADKVDAVLAQIKGIPNKFCFRNGNTKPDYDGFPGNLFISASNKTRPTIIDRNRSPLTQADGRPYSGCFVNAVLDVWAQDNQYGKGIQCSLLGIQFLRDGDAFSGAGVATEDDFDDLSDGADAPVGPATDGAAA